MVDHEENKTVELLELLLRAIDGTISDAQFARLEKQLSEEPDAVEDYVRFIMMHVAMSQSRETFMTASPSSVAGAKEINRDLVKAIEHDEQVAAELATEEASWQAKTREQEIKSVAEAIFEKFKAEEHRHQRELAYKQYRAQRQRLVCAVVSLAVLLTIAVFAWLSGLRQESTPNETLRTPAPPPVMATVTNVNNAKGSRPDKLVVGTLLSPGSLDIEAGFIEITFNNDATLILEAPVEVDLVTERLTRLSLGTVTAHVPPSARGFQVETPSICVTDLGTRFGMVVHERGVTDVHVFKGCVATSFENPRQDERDRIKTLYTNDAVRFDAEAGKTENIQTDMQQFALSWNDVLYRPITSGPVRFERTPPSTFLQDGNDHDVAILLERTNRYLPYDTTVDIVAPGNYQDFKDLATMIPGGTRVDSYLILWNPTSQVATKKRMTGSVTFTRPILGLIVHADTLLTSHLTFRHPSIMYLDRHGNRDGHGLESANDANGDTVTLSQDRCTLSFKLKAQQRMDQIRVLVSAAGANMLNEK